MTASPKSMPFRSRSASAAQPAGAPLPRFQDILDSLQRPIVVLDQAGRVAAANKRWRDFARDCGRHWIRHGHISPGGPGGPKLARRIRDVVQGRCAGFSHEWVCCGPRAERWWLFTLMHLAGGASGAVASWIDITDQKKGEKARAHLAAIVESATDAITTADSDGIVTTWNRGAERIYGYRAEEIVGRSLQLIVPRERRGELRRIRACLRAGEPVAPFETVRRRKDGTLIPVALNLSPIRNAHGEIIGASGIARDVSERRALETEVLRAAEREQRRIAQDLHDGLAQQIAGTACLAAVLKQKLEHDRSPHAAAAAKIAGLLVETNEKCRSVARGLFPVPPEPPGLVLGLRELAARTTELFHVQCSFHCRHPVMIHSPGVANHLYRIAQEAVGNAIRHGNSTRIQIRLSCRAARLLLRISDNGVGLEGSGRAPRGIGLRIMRYRAELIGAILGIRSRSRGHGTEVTCILNQN